MILEAGALRCTLAPAVGGALLSFAREGTDLLRRAPDGGTDPLETANFPLVPYANRIAHGRFTVGGQDYRLPLNFGDHPHSIHGFGWQQPWTVVEADADHALLEHRHPGDAAWPWAYRARQHVALTADALCITLTVENPGGTPMPAGLGLHPYFAVDAGATLQFQAGGLWLSTPDMLPERQVAADALGDWSRGALVAGETPVDNAYGGWDGSAILQRGDGTRLTLEAQGADWLHVFRPPGGEFLCLEPVSHMPDAINRADGMAMLAAGTSRLLSMVIRVGKSEQALPPTAKIA